MAREHTVCPLDSKSVVLDTPEQGKTLQELEYDGRRGHHPKNR